jgi:cytochrome c oxidase subunit II
VIREDWGFGIWMSDPVSSYAGDIDWLMNLLHVVMVGIFVVWSIYFVYCLFAYRGSNGHRATYHQEGEKASFIPDGLILAFEMWLILAFGIPIWAAVKEETPPPDQALVVHLVAQQFAWNFHYSGPDGKFGRREVSLISASNPLGLDEADPASADDFFTINNLNVPVGKATILNMTSKDVIHDFQVTNFRNKQDVVPGLQTRLWFTPEKTGKFEIGCAQLCGLGHTTMVGNVFVQTPEEFAEWEKGQLADRAAERAGTADARGAQPPSERSS